VLKGTPNGLALTSDVNPVYCALDPYEGGKQAVAEAARNLAMVGAEPVGLTDCLNFGNPENPEILWQFREAIRGLAEACRAFGVPVVSGNVCSPETDSHSIIDADRGDGRLIESWAIAARPSHASDRIVLLSRGFGDSAAGLLRCSTGSNGSAPPLIGGCRSAPRLAPPHGGVRTGARATLRRAAHDRPRRSLRPGRARPHLLTPRRSSPSQAGRGWRPTTRLSKPGSASRPAEPAGWAATGW
jgi:hypothetical protein